MGYVESHGREIYSYPYCYPCSNKISVSFDTDEEYILGNLDIKQSEGGHEYIILEEKEIALEDYEIHWIIEPWDGGYPVDCETCEQPINYRRNDDD